MSLSFFGVAPRSKQIPNRRLIEMEIMERIRWNTVCPNAFFPWKRLLKTTSKFFCPSKMSSNCYSSDSLDFKGGFTKNAIVNFFWTPCRRRRRKQKKFEQQSSDLRSVSLRTTLLSWFISLGFTSWLIAVGSPFFKSAIFWLNGFPL